MAEKIYQVWLSVEEFDGPDDWQADIETQLLGEFPTQKQAIDQFTRIQELLDNLEK